MTAGNRIIRKAAYDAAGPVFPPMMIAVAVASN